MKKCLEDKVRSLIESHNKALPEDKKVKAINAYTRPRIGFTGKEQIIVEYFTK
jgi:hypothetical protein